MSFCARPVNEDQVAPLARELGVSEVTARCLLARGVESEAPARSFLAPRLAGLRPPEGLAGLPRAVARLATAVQQGQRIGVFGDYDVDGVTSCALITGFLRGLGGMVSPRVASRNSGYGFTVDSAEWFAKEGCALVVVCDCGTSDAESIRLLAAKDVDVVVIDHHTVPDSAEAHPAYALINPFRQDSSFPFRGLASVGLAFYVMAALRTKLDASRELLMKQLDLVALGTVADLVPLVDENRILTRHGLLALEKRRRPGVRALLESAGAGGDVVSEQTVGWKLGPRLNAPGRLGDASPSLEVLLAEDEVSARTLAAKVEELNDQRRSAQASVLEEAEGRLKEYQDDACIVLAGEGWPSGVVGIVAARLVEQCQRPVFVIGIDTETGQGRGSGRSFGGINLYELLASAEEHLERFGGHAAAAGLTVQRDKVDALRSVLCAGVSSHKVEPEDSSLVDAEVTLETVSEKLTQELLALGPFGKGNEAPVLGTRRVRVASSRRVGDGSHLKLELVDGGRRVDAIGFGLGEQDPGVDALVDVCFAPSINVWRGRRSVQLELRSVQLAD